MSQSEKLSSMVEKIKKNLVLDIFFAVLLGLFVAYRYKTNELVFDIVLSIVSIIAIFILEIVIYMIGYYIGGFIVKQTSKQ